MPNNTPPNNPPAKSGPSSSGIATSQPNPQAAHAQAQADNQRKAAINKQTSNLPAKDTPPAGVAGQQEGTCPFCGPQAKVKDKSAGKYILNIHLIFTKFTLQLPRIFDFIPKLVGFDANHEGSSCSACGGSKKIKDVSDDTAKYQQIARETEDQTSSIIELESKLGEGNSRHSMIFGNDILQVGAVFNNNIGYRIEPKGGLAVTGNGGGIPQMEGAQCAKVVPIPGALKWPAAIGNYVIQCANSFNLNAGGGGISLLTKGNMELKGGITTISAPQLTVAVDRGPLVIGADSISVNANYINIAPSKGTFFVKGSIHNSGNMITTGHSHSESISFAKAACCGVNQPTTTDQGNKDIAQTQPATWGGIMVNAITTSLFDAQMFYADVPLNMETAITRLVSPAEIQNTIDRFKTLTKMLYPVEYLPTGLCVTAVGIGLVYNFPHTHGLGAMNHTHNIRVPDIDFSANSPKELRSKVLNKGTYSNAPADPVRDSLLKKIKSVIAMLNSAFGMVKQLIELAYNQIRLSP